MAVDGNELFSNDDGLWLVERNDTGYLVHHVTTTRAASFHRKWQAIEAITNNEVDTPVLDDTYDGLDEPTFDDEWSGER